MSPRWRPRPGRLATPVGAAAAAVAATLVLAGCGGATSSTSSAGGSSAAPKQGGELTIIESGNMTSWDPASAGGSLPGLTWDRLYAVYGALITVDGKGTVQPGLAQSLTTSDGGKTWTLTLRDGLAFTDGQKLDATAVKTNFDRAAASKLGGSSVAKLFTSQVVDATKLVITPTTADPVLDKRIAEAIPFVASPASLQQEGSSYTKPVGAGPFVLQSTDAQTGEVFKANPHYYVKGEPHLDTLKMSIVTDPAQRINTVVQGGADFMNGYPFQFSSATGNPSVKTHSVTSGGIRSFVFNTTKQPFSDVRVRRAVAMAVDPDELMQTLTQDPSAKGSTTLFPKGSPYYDASAKLPAQDLEQAQSLIDQAKAAGVAMNVKIVIPNAPENVRVGELLQSSLQKLKGLNVTVQQVALPDWRAKTYTNDDFDITPYPGVFDLASPQIAMANLFKAGGTDDFSNFDNPDMNAALAAAQSATDQSGIAQAMKKVQAVYADQVPIVVFGADTRAFLYRTDAGGIETMGRGALYLDRLYRTQ